MKFVEERALRDAFWKKYGNRPNILVHQFECAARHGGVDLLTVESVKNRSGKKTGTCDLGIILESTLCELVVDVWNDIVLHQDQYQDRRKRMIEKGDALENLRAGQMKALVKEGPLKTECSEMTKMILREITVMDSMNFRVVLMNGTEKTVCMALGA